MIAFLIDRCTAAQNSEPRKPNVLIIVADDMGFSDAGCYGGEIATPNLDFLANGGLRFTQCYNTSRCWPSRAAILTGYYAQQVRRDTVPGIKSGAQGVRPAWARLLPEMLKPLGYRSYHSGKWHVDGTPLQNGFDHSYGLDDHDRHFAPKKHHEDDQPLPAIEPNSGYYSSTSIADHAIAYLKEHADKYSSKPFFEFVAFTAPHFPLQAPPEEIARYRKKYLAGWDAMRDERWRRLQDLHIGGSSLAAIERDVGPPYEIPDAMEKLGANELNRPLPWKDLTVEQQEFQANKMAIHAAMVDRMDQEIGRVLDQLKSMDAIDNTLVFFLSDNGASAEIMVRGDGHDPHAECGTGATFLSIGPGWSSLANTPFRRHKTWVHEGGISTPLIVHWPNGFAARGELRQTPCHIIDLVPTILEAAGTKPVATWNEQPLPPLPGKSLIPVFTHDGTVTRDFLWWYHEGNRALRVGDWKIVAAGENGPWELYDLGSDRSETKNLSLDNPDKVRELAVIWTNQLDEYAALAGKDLAADETKRPNVLFLFADDQRADTIAALGNSVIQTPNLDRLVKRGVTFNRAYMQGGLQGATCVPSRAMLLSGRSLFRIDEGLKRDPTWPKAFGHSGYTTFVTGKWHNDPDSISASFQTARAIFAGGMADPLKTKLSDLVDGKLTEPKLAPKHACAVFADEAIQFLKNHAQGPFFCYVAFDAPHDPHIVPNDFPIHYDPDKVPLPANYLPQHPFDNGQMVIRDEELLPWPRPPEQVRLITAEYYRYISYLDSQIGRVLDALDASPHAANTIVVFSADSGVARGSHGLIGKQNLYEHSVRVPLIISGPNIPAGKTSSALCYLFDVLPTLGNLCGVPAPSTSEGLDFTAVLRDPTKPARSQLLFAYRDVQRALCDTRWKLIRYPQVDQTQLFDLENDPNETTNLADRPEHVAKVAALTELLRQQQKNFGDTAPLTVPNPSPAAWSPPEK